MQRPHFMDGTQIQFHHSKAHELLLPHQTVSGLESAREQVSQNNLENTGQILYLLSIVQRLYQGGVAQSVEYMLCKHGARGSKPRTSTFSVKCSILCGACRLLLSTSLALLGTIDNGFVFAIHNQAQASFSNS
jgi:hypothetical protein